ncbi:MAG TPA: SRPBCC domain-containing protein [Acidimicrobiia bacterium]|jgi:uncharacterized protein YndB with AHSA1/START domain
MSTRADENTVVRTTVDVEAPPDLAFRVFTDGIDTWWNREHHVQSGALKVVGVDPQVGGRMWEENDAGDVCTWGQVLTWDPPREFAFSWLLGADFGVPKPDAVGSRVTVTFTPTDSGTRVELVHDQLDAHGPGWQGMRDGVGSEGGWPSGIRDFAAAADAAARG